MKKQLSSVWMRRGLSLLWGAAALSRVVEPSGVVSIRRFFAMTKSWPVELPGTDGDALIVAGVEGCLDALSGDDGKTWLETDLKRVILGFQDEYQGQAALIFWLPSGRRRINMASSTEEYFWRNSPPRSTPGLPIGQCLWAGAQSDVERIIVSDARDPDTDGVAYVGLYHPRIS